MTYLVLGVERYDGEVMQFAHGDLAYCKEFIRYHGSEVRRGCRIYDLVLIKEA